MKIKFLLLTLLISFFSCNKNEFEEFDFSFGNTFETDFSIKFNSKNDSVFLRENWSPNEAKSPKSKTNYFAKLNKNQKKELDSFIKNIDFKSFDTLYFEKYSDGEYYNFYLEKNVLKKSIKIHSHNAPKSLEKFAFWI